MLPCLCNVGIEASIWTLKTESEETGCGPPALAEIPVERFRRR